VNTDQARPADVCIVGGAGHVGAPLAVVLAARGFDTLIYDVDTAAVRSILDGVLPFAERGGDVLLRSVLAAGRLRGSGYRKDLDGAETIVVTIATPGGPSVHTTSDTVLRCVAELLPHLRQARLLILRSTVPPGTTDRLQQFLEAQGFDLPVAFCPERVLQGHAIDEIQRMPQIIGATNPDAGRRAAAVFARVTRTLIPMTPTEAEFAKLFCNAYRYIQFAATNQFFMMAREAGCDYGRIVEGMTQDYPRMSGFPVAGFAAGPCLVKDTWQLATSAHDRFGLAHAAISVNEGLPAFLVDDLLRQYPLRGMTVGILGMAFKGNSDDVRFSLSYKLKTLLHLHAAAVLTTDPFVTVDPELLHVDDVVARSDLLIIAAPHAVYASLDPAGKPLVDIWNLRSVPFAATQALSR
jgi:UDP-N-acetyl-D-mannosaminuronic acid dehydrogenase